MGIKRIAGRSATAVVAGVIGVVIGGLGIATAGSGGAAILGAHNSESSPMTIANSHGPALELKAGHGKPALTVDSTKEIKHLNAAMVGGSTAGALKTSGSGAASDYRPGYGNFVSSTPVEEVATTKLRAGTYYVNASAFMMVAPSSEGGCAVSTTNLATATEPIFQGAMNNPGTEGINGTVSVTTPVKVAAGKRIALFCWASSASTLLVFKVGMTATRIASATAGTVKAGAPLV